MRNSYLWLWNWWHFKVTLRILYPMYFSIFDWNENKTLSLFVFAVFEISFNFSSHPTTSDGPDIVFLTWEREKQDCKTKRIGEAYFSGHIYLPCSFQFLLVLLPENNKEIAELRKTIKRKGRRILLHIIGKQSRMNTKYFHILSFTLLWPCFTLHTWGWW